MSQETMPNWLDKRAKLTPNRVAIYFEKESITFEQLRQQSLQLAKKLTTIGVRKGTHLAVYGHNSVDFVRCVHAISYIGAVGVFLNTKLTAKEIVYQIEDAQCNYVIYDDALIEQMECVRDQTEVTACSFSALQRITITPFERKEEVDLADLHTILYTSGTTGYPKGVMLSYGNHWWSAVSSALNLGISDKDEWLVAMPLFHVGGLSTLFKSVIYGMPVHLYASFDVEAVHEAIMHQGVSHVSVVSLMANRLLKRLGEGQYPSCFRCMLLGGGPAAKPLLERAAMKQIPIIQTYGMTETSSQIVTLSAEDALKKIGSAGKALFSAECKIMIDYQEARPNEVGEIVVKGPMVTKGYYNRPDVNAQTIIDGWLYTGDAGYLDEDGYLYVVDRRKDLIISGGENIYPAEIESVLIGMEAINEVGVIGQEDCKWGQVPVAFIVVNKSYEVTFDEVMEYTQPKLAKYKLPKRIYVVSSLPRNASNKLMRRQLAEWLERGDVRIEHALD
ncbi:o-succinylbenzoate--CoA ligase [Pontibacillus litoralis]|uniref:2-succinylbenzoate--CoA ligase n=1 Tax=Pontibacillus litoralis JSM 072002 TaxID=1385512 RepID=A0A0A5G6M4_9BACI|nr:o-succinylbenzoate--CoA ligase [Pontibacillus litoralis]KGX86750.1 O-succinylbenzoic acid--CoA ligase [Pontibacillus litoralis JSM 072002]